MKTAALLAFAVGLLSAQVDLSSEYAWNLPKGFPKPAVALVPMYGVHPVELGLRKDDGFLLALRGDPRYRDLFTRAFPAEKDPFALANVTKALASFERTIISARSPYDRYHCGGDDSAVSESGQRGETLFFN